MKVLVTGASGQLGYDVCATLEEKKIRYYGISSLDADITDFNALERVFAAFLPSAVIHCAAYTKVDQAEDEQERCWNVNVLGSKNVAELCKKYRAKMLYISTDYVFNGDGTQPFEINDKTEPLNVYGKTKLEGEKIVQQILNEFFVVRISWVFGRHGQNFVKTMLELGQHHSSLRITGDEVGSPTYTKDVAELLCNMILTEKYGIYHVTNEGYCSWAEFASEVFRCAGMNVTVTPRLASERPSKAIRPHNSRLSKKSLIENGFALLPDWRDALARYLENEGRTSDD